MNPRKAFIEPAHSIFTLVQRRHHLNDDRLSKVVFILIVHGNCVYRWDNKSEEIDDEHMDIGVAARELSEFMKFSRIERLANHFIDFLNSHNVCLSPHLQ